MSTCTLLLVSKAGCGISESPQPPLQTDLSEHCILSGHHCLLSGESNTLGECIEHFEAADFCSHFGAGGHFSQFLESSLRGEIVVQSAHCIGQNMPAENCADQTKVSGREAHKGNDHACGLCLNSMDQKSSFDSTEDSEVQGLNEAMEHIYEAGEVEFEQRIGTPELPEQSYGTETLCVHSESSQICQTEEVFFENGLCTNLVSTSEVSEQHNEQNVQSEQIKSTAELQTNNFESSQQSRSFGVGADLGETFELNSQLSTVSEELVDPDEGGPLHSELPDPIIEHTESFQQCEPCTQYISSHEEADYTEVSESEVSERAFEKLPERDCETAADVFKSSEHSISAVDCELGEHLTPTDLKAENCEAYDAFVEQPCDVNDGGEQPVPSEDLRHYCASLENSQHARLLCSIENTEVLKESMLPDAAAEECQPTVNSAEHCKTPEQCESSEHFELAKQCSSLDSCAKYYRATKINKPCQHHSAHCEQLKDRQKTQCKSESDILLSGSMDTFENLWISQFVIEPTPDTLSLEEYECCENCDLCDHSFEHMEANEDGLSPDHCDSIQLEEKVQSCGHSFECSNSEVSVHCIACEESETAECSAVSYHNVSSHRTESQEDILCGLCTDCEGHKNLDFLLNHNGLFEHSSDEVSDISTSDKPDVESLDGSEGDDYHPCDEKSQDSSETGSFKTCSDGNESDENCSESSYSTRDKLQAEETEENDPYPIHEESFVSPHVDSQDSYRHYTEDGMDAEDESCEFSLEGEDQTCANVWTAEDRQSADLCTVDSQFSSVEELYIEEDGSEPDSEGDRLEPQIDEEGPEPPRGSGEVYGDRQVEKTQQGGQLSESPSEEKLSQPSIGHALYQSQTLRLFLERRRLSEAEAYGHCGADVCRLDLIFDPWAEVETNNEKEPSEVVAEGVKDGSEAGSVQEEDSEVYRKDDSSTIVVEGGEGITPSPDNCEHHRIIPEILFSETLDEEKDEETAESREKNEGLLSSPDIPYGIETSETPEPRCFKETDEGCDELSEFLKPDQGDGFSEHVEKAKLPEHKRAESVTPEIFLLSDLITQQTKPTENSVDHAKTSENNVESSEHCASHEFFKLAEEGKTPEPSEEIEEIESEDEEIPEACQCEFCAPTDEVLKVLFVAHKMLMKHLINVIVFFPACYVTFSNS